MKKILLLYICCIVMLTVHAQTNNAALDSLKSDIKVIGSLFKKKKKDTSNVITSAAPGDAVNATAKGSVYIAGKNSVNVRIIDCDGMYPFNLGAAVIRKGNAYALIDSAGNFIIPWNKYFGIKASGNKYNTGIFEAKIVGESLNVFINSNGKIIYDAAAEGNRFGEATLSADGKFIILQPKLSSFSNDQLNTSYLKYTVIDKDGNRFTLSMAFDGYNTINDSVCVFVPPSSNRKGGYDKIMGIKNLQNEIILPLSTLTINNFYHGVATFSVEDQFGKIQYGIINKKGNVISNAIFPNMPSAFMSDIVQVPGTANSDYYNEFVNMQTGRIIYKETTKNVYGSFSPIPYTSYAVGKINNQEVLLDSSGNITTLVAFLKSIGIKVGPGEKFQFCNIETSSQTEGSLLFELLGSNGLQIRDQILCLYNIATGDKIFGDFRSVLTIADGIFSGTPELPLVKFDPVSHLSLVTLPTDKKDNYGRPIFLRGYMNAKGKMMMIQSQEQ